MTGEHKELTDTSALIKQSPDFVLRDIHGHYLIIPIKSHLDGHVLNINEVGAFIWGILENGSKIIDIVAKVAEKYGQQPSLEKDVSSFIDKLLGLGIAQQL